MYKHSSWRGISQQQVLRLKAVSVGALTAGQAEKQDSKKEILGIDAQGLVPRPCLRNPYFLTCIYIPLCSRVRHLQDQAQLQLHRPGTAQFLHPSTHPGQGEMSPATTSTLQIHGQGLKQKAALGSTHSKQQHTANSSTLPPAPAAATANEKGWHLKGWIAPASACAALAFPYLSLVPSSSLLAWPLVLGRSCF